MIKATAVLSLFTLPLFAGGADNGAMSALLGFADETSMEAPVVPASPSEPAEQVQARTWDAEVKKTCEAYLENGRLFSMPKARLSRLPQPALRLLGRDGSRKPLKAEAYELKVEGLPAFVIFDEDGGATIRVFDACGRLVAAGRPGIASDFRWDDIFSAPEAGTSCGRKSVGQPDGHYDGGPDGGHYWDDHGGGPDSTYDGIDGGPGWDGVNSGGFDGSGGVYF